MNRVIKLCVLPLIIVFFGIPDIVLAQINPQFEKHYVVDSEFYEGSFLSISEPNILKHPSIGSFEVFPDEQNPGSYKYEYRPGKGVELLTEAVVEYWREEEGVIVPDYTTLVFYISQSLIKTNEDREMVYLTNVLTGVDVLANDEATHGPLVLNDILHVSAGEAYINNDRVVYTPDDDFTGDAFVYYSAQDVTGRTQGGKLKITIVDPADIKKYDEINVVSNGGEAVEIRLPLPGFQVEGVVQNGSFETVNGIQMYVPNSNADLQESFTVIKDNLTRKINATVKYKDRKNSWVRDDHVFTSKGTEVIFDVEANDLKKNQEILSYSPELLPTDQKGVFSFTPSPYFNGRKNLEYTVYNGFEAETGKVVVSVNNFFPNTKYDYEFQSLSNSVLVVDYNIPIQDFSFQVIEQASNGYVSVNHGESEVTLGCALVSGNNLILYQPAFNFIGSDQFTVQYCVDGQCEDITIQVNVIPNSLQGCQCYTGCVWAGDANSDGLVNSIDLISIGYALGSSGSASEWNGTEGWIGRNTEDWIFTGIQGVNAKFADSDGNGVVNEKDFLAVEEHYDKNHALVPPQMLDNKSYPFSLIPLQDTIYAGDRVEISVGVGSASYPALDVHGLAYSIGLPPSLVDSSSVQLVYSSESWLGVDDAVYGLSHQVSDGWIETAVSRMMKRPKSGYGEIGTLSFIVEEDILGGFRIKDGIIPLRVNIEEGYVLNGSGELSSVKGGETTVYINLNKPEEEVLSDLEVLIFPNPGKDNVNVHLNGNKSIKDIELFNSLGSKMSVYPVNGKQGNINISNLDDGNYILRINSDVGPIVKKLQVIK